MLKFQKFAPTHLELGWNHFKTLHKSENSANIAQINHILLMIYRLLKGYIDKVDSNFMTNVSILHRFLQTASSEIQKLLVNVKIGSKMMV